MSSHRKDVIQATSRQRYHNAPASQTGPLGDASTDPKARVTYTAHWHDPIGRQTATAAYGTNGGTALVRPDTIPQRSDTVLVTATGYNDAGEAFQTIDPAGREDRQFFDAAGRIVKTILRVGNKSASVSEIPTHAGCLVTASKPVRPIGGHGSCQRYGSMTIARVRRVP